MISSIGLVGLVGVEFHPLECQAYDAMFDDQSSDDEDLVVLHSW